MQFMWHHCAEVRFEEAFNLKDQSTEAMSNSCECRRPSHSSTSTVGVVAGGGVVAVGVVVDDAVVFDDGDDV